MNAKLLVMDIDGTLVGKDGVIKDADRNAICTFMQQGGRAYVATGRKYASAAAFARQISPDVGVIASNGSVVSSPEGLSVTRIPLDALQYLYRVAMQVNAPMFFFGLEQTFYTGPEPTYFSAEERARLVAGERAWLIKIENEESLAEHAPDIVNGIIVCEDGSVDLDALRHELGHIPNLTVSSSHFNNIELIAGGVDKAVAIRHVQQLYDILPEQTIAFGDGNNDVGMFEVADISVAMGNAPDEVKRRARFCTASVEEAGIAHFLNTRQ